VGRDEAGLADLRAEEGGPGGEGRLGPDRRRPGPLLWSGQGLNLWLLPLRAGFRLLADAERPPTPAAVLRPLARGEGGDALGDALRAGPWLALCTAVRSRRREGGLPVPAATAIAST